MDRLPLRAWSASDSKKRKIFSRGLACSFKRKSRSARRGKESGDSFGTSIACVPGCKEARTLEEGKRYAAVMTERVGPFKVEFPTTIEVLEREELTHIKAQASGADNKIGSRMKIDLDVNLRELENRTILQFVAGVDILGKLAALGHGIIKRKADQVLEEFAQSVKQKLEGEA
jgi:carbon monoxide dehydrogenase subunit G